MEEICYKPIGIVRSEFKKPEQHDEFEDSGIGEVELFEEFAPGLEALKEHFSHVLVVFHMHNISWKGNLKVKPPHGDFEIGVFASGGPWRPNPIGVTPCRILEVNGNKLKLKGLDAMDGSPVLDIKPYSPHHYTVLNPRYGEWEDKHHKKKYRD